MDNKYINENCYWNMDKGTSKKNFFLFPTVILSKKNFISWEIMSKNITFTIFNKYYQFNFYYIIKNSNKDLFKVDIDLAALILNQNNYKITNLEGFQKWLDEKKYILTLLKNTHKDNSHLNNIIFYYLEDCEHIDKK